MRKKIVLYLDDQFTTTQAACRMLDQMDMSVKRANTLGEAICHLQERKFDVIIADWWMDGGAGERLLTWMRSQQREDPVIIMSGDADYGLLVELINKGAVDLLPKPLQPGPLRRSLDMALGLNMLTA